MGAIVKGIQSLVIALGIIAVVGTGAVLYYNIVNPNSPEPQTPDAVIAQAQEEENAEEEKAVEDDTSEEDVSSPEEGEEADDMADADDEGITVTVPASEPDHEHMYSRSVSKLATCTVPGESTYKCSICGDSYTEEIPVIDHEPGDWMTVRLATDTETGLQNRYCNICGKVMEEKVLPMEDKTKSADFHQHTYETYVSREPTCTAPGERVYACVEGDSFIKSEIPPKNHPSRGSRVIEGDCGTPGTEQVICNLCNAVIMENEIIHDHKWSKWYMSIMPTNASGGTRERVCQKCGKVETKALSTSNIPSPP